MSNAFLRPLFFQTQHNRKKKMQVQSYIKKCTLKLHTESAEDAANGLIMQGVLKSEQCTSSRDHAGKTTVEREVTSGKSRAPKKRCSKHSEFLLEIDGKNLRRGGKTFLTNYRAFVKK